MKTPKYLYRRDGPSGRGEGRTRVYADDVRTFNYLCTLEGKPGSWRIDLSVFTKEEQPKWRDRFFRTRDLAMDAYLKAAAEAFWSRMT